MKLALCIGFVIAVILAMSMVACSDDATIVSHNISKAADNFEVDRRIVFYNGITDSYMLTIEGRCPILDEPLAQQLEVTCKQGPHEYTKHFLGLSDNVTYFAQQVETVDVSVYHHRVTFKPEAIVPAINLRTSADPDPDH